MRWTGGGGVQRKNESEEGRPKQGTENQKESGTTSKTCQRRGGWGNIKKCASIKHDASRINWFLLILLSSPISLATSLHMSPQRLDLIRTQRVSPVSHICVSDSLLKKTLGLPGKNNIRKCYLFYPASGVLHTHTHSCIYTRVLITLSALPEVPSSCGWTHLYSCSCNTSCYVVYWEHGKNHVQTASDHN